MTSRALCVGINEFATLPQSSWLSGCVNDADDMAATLKNHGYAVPNITVLHDSEATKVAVMGALTAMVSSSRPGDQVLFSLSSHGTQVPDLPGTEAAGDVEYDGLDEAFACHDIAVGSIGWDRDTVIVDDELRELFASVPEGVLLEVLLDTCHSGSGTRDLDDIQRDLLRGRRPRYLPPPTERALARAREIRATQETTPVELKALRSLVGSRRKSSRPVLFAACRPEQTASDAQFETRPNGAFTHLFLTALAAHPASSRADLHKAVTAGLKAEDFEQRSTLEGPAKAKQAAFGALW
ncbi:MAG: caspase family protein [Humibacillus sp.]